MIWFPVPQGFSMSSENAGWSRSVFHDWLKAGSPLSTQRWQGKAFLGLGTLGLHRSVLMRELSWARSLPLVNVVSWARSAGCTGWEEPGEGPHCSLPQPPFLHFTWALLLYILSFCVSGTHDNLCTGSKPTAVSGY